MMAFRLQVATLLLAMSLLSGCGSVSVQDYADNAPVLDPETFFDGYLTAHGVIKDRGGKVIRYFNADITA